MNIEYFTTDYTMTKSIDNTVNNTVGSIVDTFIAENFIESPLSCLAHKT